VKIGCCDLMSLSILTEGGVALVPVRHYVCSGKAYSQE